MAAIVTLAEAAQQYARRAADATRKLYKRAVRPIFLSRDGKRVEALGSAILINFNGTPSVVTAAHVLDEGEHGSLHLGGHPGFHPLETFQVTNKVDGSREGDHADVAISVLAPGVADALAHLGFVAPEHQQSEPSAGDGRIYLLMGFRISQNKVGYISKGELPLQIWTCTTGAVSIPDGGSRQFGGELNFGLDYPRRMQRATGEGVPTTPPRGVSGGAIFEICDLADVERVAANVVPPPKLVGVFIECTGRVLIGTKLRVVRDMLKHRPA